MKKILFSLVVVILCFSAFTTTAQTSASKINYANQNLKSALAGAWQSTDGTEFAMMNEDGFFSSISKDSTGMWASTYAGTYTVDNANTLTFKVMYSSHPDHVGALHTVEYEVKGDNLTIKWFKKLVDAKEGDITARMPKGQQTMYMRAKK
ncbi:lipocalin-like domain-containing protein [Flavisolibacter tropicus]|uniref:Uncharacterized protein n=1 Tax=Flavisolibacter tropicus TaxID=1492898 RepID=A0A172TZ00_9BACT|nr:lipocalin-like domain-containing protein [Flavisolibacter tropicus]ANE52178.1 hypothetical protein SY85_18440 [Flavisolibacter tropicus]